jgi:hypothetical protein
VQLCTWIFYCSKVMCVLQHHALVKKLRFDSLPEISFPAIS